MLISHSDPRTRFGNHLPGNVTGEKLRFQPYILTFLDSLPIPSSCSPYVKFLRQHRIGTLRRMLVRLAHRLGGYRTLCNCFPSFVQFWIRCSLKLGLVHKMTVEYFRLVRKSVSLQFIYPRLESRSPCLKAGLPQVVSRWHLQFTAEFPAKKPMPPDIAMRKNCKDTNTHRGIFNRRLVVE